MIKNKGKMAYFEEVDRIGVFYRVNKRLILERELIESY